VDRRFILAHTDPEPDEVLGYRLAPFCLRDRVRLHAIESPFVEGSGFTPSSVVAALKTCAGQSLREITMKDKALIARMDAEPEFLENTVRAFTQRMYMEHWPKFWESGKLEQRASGMPWIMNLVANLISNGVPEERAWTMPECQAVWLSTCFSGMKGAEVNLLTTEDEEAMAAFTASQG
jgi:hypothetical protein